MTWLSGCSWLTVDCKVLFVGQQRLNLNTTLLKSICERSHIVFEISNRHQMGSLKSSSWLDF